MAIKIKWTAEARNSFDANVNYLHEKWSDKEIILFLKQTEFILSRIQEYPEFYRPSKKSRKVRRARMNKYITLYYSFNSISGTITLLSFWHEKQDTNKLKF